MKGKILLIDDDSEIRTLVSEMLKSHDYQVVTAENGPGGLDVLDKNKESHGVDVIFLDLMMPGMSGFIVLEELKKRAHASKIPVIMLTAQDSGMDMIQGYQVGADYYIPKPFTRSQLLFGLDLVVDGSKQGAESSETQSSDGSDLESWFEGKK